MHTKPYDNNKTEKKDSNSLPKSYYVIQNNEFLMVRYLLVFADPPAPSRKEFDFPLASLHSSTPL